MLTGKQKAQVLLSMLGDRSKSVLSLLSPTHAALLTEMIEEAPKPSASVLNSLLTEIMQKVTRVRETGSLVEKKPSTADSGFSLGGGLGMGMSFEEDEAPSDEPETEESGEPKEKLRSPDQIAVLLSEQRPQLVAFILSRIEESLSDEIRDCLPLDMAQKLSSLNVASVPLSQHVFDSLYQEVFVLPPEDAVPEESGFAPMEAAEKEEPNRVFFF